MSDAVAMAEVWRGAFLESVHRGHAVICDSKGDILAAWGDADALILPRSSSKMIQALPLVESGAADSMGLQSRHLALACASHQAAAIHVEPVTKWLKALGLEDSDLRCGPQAPRDPDMLHRLIREGRQPQRVHNNCSGKHCGFLTLSRHLGSGPEYVERDHPVQIRVAEAFQHVTGMESPGHAVDGCSAPNHATRLRGLARAMAYFAAADPDSGNGRQRAAARLVRAMIRHPELVGGEGRACTALMRAAGGRAAVKIGAEGVYAAIIPEQKIGIALKIEDGAKRAAEVAMAALLKHVGILAPEHPVLDSWMRQRLTNFAGLETGWMHPAAGFPA